MRLFDYIEQGGPIMYVLLLINILGVALMIFKLFNFMKEKKSIEETADLLSHRLKNETKGKSSEAIIELSKRELSAYMNQIEKGLSTIKSIATISPLLGLLGTVIGVLVSFQVISVTGMNDPGNFAQGISMALLTTVAGMIVAIPHYIGHNFFLSYLDFIEVNLEKKLLSKVL